MKSRAPTRFLEFAATCAVLLLVVLIGAGSAGAVTPAEIEGSGSSWAENAVNQWVSDVYSQGVQVVYNPDGDAQGRQDFANKVSDFSVTADGYQGRDPVTGVTDTSQGRQYAYLPIAAGGTAFPYQIRIDGTQVENLRLSGQTLAKIFTNQITNWSNPEITADNNGHALPTLPIVPVVQSEGSGSTEQLTNYFAKEFPNIWQPFSGTPGATEYFPRQGSQIAQDGSNAAMNYVSSSEANGSIGYVEYSFALSVNYPVAKVLNDGGYYTLPTQYNVAVALEKAQITMNPSSSRYLLQTLDNVYTDTDPRTYPLSSYVYMIEPTGAYPKPETKITPGKRQAIADFAYYGICQGQKEIGPLGYSPLPVNLVTAAFGQIRKLQQADPSISLTKITINNCDEPTFVPGNPTVNYLTTIAPLPPSCDAQGAGPCAAGVTPNGIGATPTVSGSYPGASAAGAANAAAGTSSSSSSSTAAGGGTSAVGASASTQNAATTSGGGAATGRTAAGGQSPGAGASGASDTDQLQQESAVLPAKGALTFMGATGPLVVGLLLVVFLVPVGLGYRRVRRRREAAQ
ncbi:MAG: substrate-binding domain-containing protein [Acidimicrobiales bacterium]